MITKLTLTIEQTVIEQAKAYAKQKGQSLSGMVENYLRSVSADKEGDTEAIKTNSLVRSLRGSFKDKAGADYDRDLSDALADKHHLS
jgi:hypothetical protein